MSMRIDEQEVKEAFARYLRAYDVHDPKIALKVTHTYKVAELCRRIAQEEGFDEGFVALAWLSGILHDVGRFEQLARFNTFSDAQSISHAKLSVSILFDEGKLASFVPDYDRVSCGYQNELQALKAAIALHSDWRLPTGLDEKTRALCDVLRDADKIDIMRVNCSCPVDVIYPFGQDELEQSLLSPEVVDAFYQRQTIPTKLKIHPADFALGHCAFGWELVFKASRSLALEQGFLFKLFDHDWRQPCTRDTFAHAKREMHDWLTFA